MLARNRITRANAIERKFLCTRVARLESFPQRVTVSPVLPSTWPFLHDGGNGQGRIEGQEEEAENGKGR